MGRRRRRQRAVAQRPHVRSRRQPARLWYGGAAPGPRPHHAGAVDTAVGTRPRFRAARQLVPSRSTHSILWPTNAARQLVVRSASRTLAVRTGQRRYGVNDGCDPRRRHRRRRRRRERRACGGSGVAAPISRAGAALWPRYALLAVDAAPARATALRCLVGGSVGDAEAEAEESLQVRRRIRCARRRWGGRGERTTAGNLMQSPGADVVGVSPVPVQMWQG
jgi:hypothetical protein